MRFRSPTSTPVRVALTTGHVLLIGPELTEVPDFMVREAVANGAIPEGVSPELMQLKSEAGTDASITARIREALQTMLAERDTKEGPDEFTANGLPSVSAVSRRVGQKVSKEEVLAVWAEVNGDGDGD